MILISKHIVPRGYVGITIFPFMFLKYKTLKEDKILINHERIHLRQQIELFVIPFFVVYGTEFLLRLIQYKKWHLAYRNISFEREAFKNETDLNFLEKRPCWNFINYF
ncbi:MAG: hypothetical protein HKN40_06035 [Winogradskyella sp.]|uniref:hypothetical protein n=1 Tax=Winogradskyella sp. TaxID=1883156 RepID=UPI00184615B3|nr:hypothetical protein [Winogradskyella sp.]